MPVKRIANMLPSRLNSSVASPPMGSEGKPDIGDVDGIGGCLGTTSGKGEAPPVSRVCHPH